MYQEMLYHLIVRGKLKATITQVVGFNLSYVINSSGTYDKSAGKGKCYSFCILMIIENKIMIMSPMFFEIVCFDFVDWDIGSVESHQLTKPYKYLWVILGFVI